jgi:hypothetical protein
MDNYNNEIKSIIKIKKEIEILLSEINQKENILANNLKKNIDDITLYKNCLENIIEEYHLFCKKIYN